MKGVERWSAAVAIGLAVIVVTVTTGYFVMKRSTTIARVAWTSKQLHRRRTPAKNEGFDPPPNAPNLVNLGKRKRSQKVGTRSREVEEKVTVEDRSLDPHPRSRTRTETRKRTIVEDQYSESMDDYFSWDTTGIQEVVAASLTGTDNTIEYPPKAPAPPGWFVSEVASWRARTPPARDRVGPDASSAQVVDRDAPRDEGVRIPRRVLVGDDERATVAMERDVERPHLAPVDDHVADQLALEVPPPEVHLLVGLDPREGEAVVEHRQRRRLTHVVADGRRGEGREPGGGQQMSHDLLRLAIGQGSHHDAITAHAQHGLPDVERRAGA